MAKIIPNLPDEFIAQLEELGDDAGRVIGLMLEAGAEILYKDIRDRLQRHQETGDLRKSIRVGKISKKNGVYRIKVYPSGKSKGKGEAKPVPNASVFLHLEYGTRHQQAVPLIRTSVAENEDKLLARMQDIFDFEMSLKNLPHA